MGAKRQERVTLKEIAEHSGLSPSTVSLVLRNSPLVADGTRRKVQASIDVLGYVYNRSAANLRGAASKAVGLLIGEITNPFYAELTAGVDAVLERADHIAFLGNTQESVERQGRFLARLREQNVDGVILCPAEGSTGATLKPILGWGMPCVQTLRYLQGVELDYVGADYRLGMQMAVEHLVRLGHRRIALVGGAMHHSAVRERRAGFRDAMERAGLAGDLIVPCPLTRRHGAEAVEDLMERADQPTGIIAYNDIVALGVMQGLERHGLRIGADVAVIGCDNIEEAALAEPGLTTVATNPRRIGEEAASLLLRRIENPRGARDRVIVPPCLVVRRSCGEAAA